MSDIKIITLQESYFRPDPVEIKSQGWVMNGKKNQFYYDIIDAYNGSPTNAAVINSYSDLVYGRGLMQKSGSVSDWVKVKQVLSSQTVRNLVSDKVMFNEQAMEIIQTKGKGISSINHLPKYRVIPSIEDEKGQINNYFFSRDWRKWTMKENRPIEQEAFNGKGQKSSIYVSRPYKAGKDYFADPDYLAAMPYMTMEQEIANVNVSSIQNGLARGYIINVPGAIGWDEKKKQAYYDQLKKHLTGSPNASGFVLSYNGIETEVTITPIPVNERIHKQWEFWAGESRQQILTGHRVTSPMLFGVKDNTGLGNNADELEKAREALLEDVIYPKRQAILDPIYDVLELYGINVKMDFKNLRDPAPKTQVALSKQNTDLDDFLAKGEDYDSNDDFMLVNESEVDYEAEDALTLKLASTGTARPNSNSSQDTKDIVIRYRYVGNKFPQREFCVKMMSAGKVYRKEDIIQMESKSVNPGWGANGANTYSIWLYKGGGSCHHAWNRVIYLRKGTKVDVNSPLAEVISTSEARRRGYKVETNENLVSIMPTNMVNEGFLKPR